MRFVYVGVGLLAGSVILLQIALTRVFAVMMWHHLTYMAISIAMLGFGAAGSLLTVRRDDRDATIDVLATQLAKWSACYGASVVLCFFLATRIPIDTLALWREKINLLHLALLYLIVLVPFGFAGTVIGLALTRIVRDVNRLYFADLVGSGLGGAVSVVLLSTLGSSSTVIAASSLGLLAALAFCMGGSRRSLRLYVPLWLASLALAATLAGIGPRWLEWEIPFAPGKEFARQPDGAVIDRIPSSTAEIEVGPPLVGLPGIGGNFGDVDRKKVALRTVGQDGTAPTMLFENAASLERFPFLDDSQSGSAYVALAARGHPATDVAVIGVGGGIDVMIALYAGARSVTAIEFNSAMVEMVTRRYDDYLGGLFDPDDGPHAERVELVNAEGRAFMRRDEVQYDVIQLSGVDSFTALSTGAYTLAESYLYSIEAVQDFYGSLNEGGIVNYSRFFMEYPKKPRETLRLANIAREALERLGVENPQRHILVFLGNDWASTMIRRGPFTRVEVDALHEFARRQGFWGIVFDPLQVDESPRPTPRPEKPGMRPLFDAFAHNQMLFSALLRGSAAERREIESRYEYDITPTTDDNPFFFNYYRYSGLWKDSDASTPSDEATNQAEAWRLIRMLATDPYHPDFPVGHMVLLASLVQIALVATLLIFVPLRALDRRGLRLPDRWRILAYFAALGMGFMFVEIVLMQKMVMFLGHPTYSISVVLTSLLLSAGVGSLIAGRIAHVSPATLLRLTPFLIAALALEWIAVEYLLPEALSWALPARIATVVVTITPLGVALGMPFPLGLRVVAQRAPELLPWAWAINGFLSVLSSVLCIVLAMAVGFSAVFITSAIIYAAGLLVLGSARAHADVHSHGSTALGAGSGGRGTR